MGHDDPPTDTGPCNNFSLPWRRVNWTQLNIPAHVTGTLAIYMFSPKNNNRFLLTVRFIWYTMASFMIILKTKDIQSINNPVGTPVRWKCTSALKGLRFTNIYCTNTKLISLVNNYALSKLSICYNINSQGHKKFIAIFINFRKNLPYIDGYFKLIYKLSKYPLLWYST